MNKAFSILFLLFVASLLMSTAGISIFLWSLFIVFMIHFTADVKAMGFKPALAQLKCGLEIPLLFFVAWTFISSLINVGTLQDFAACAWEMRFVLGFYFLTYLFKKYLKENQTKLFYTTCGVVILCGAYGLFQTLTGLDLVRGTVLVPFGNFFRAPGFFSISLTYAYIIGMLGMYCYAYGITHLSEKNKYFHFAGIAFLFSMIGTVSSWTRGAWIAVFIATLTITYIYDKKIFLKAFSIALALCCLLLINPDFRYRAATITNISDYNSNTERIEIWKANLQILRDNPVFGLSWNQNDSNENLKIYYQRAGIENPKLFDHAHNDYINIAAKLGYPGILAFIWMVLGFLYKNYRGLKQTLDLQTRTILLGALGAQIVFYIGSMTQANFTDMEVNHTLFFTWALIESLTSKTIK